MPVAKIFNTACSKIIIVTCTHVWYEN